MSTDIVIGIDISGKSLDIHILPEDRAQRFANDASGIGELVELAKEMEASLIVMEANLRLPQSARFRGYPLQ